MAAIATLAETVTVCGIVLALATTIARGGKLPRGSGWMDEPVPGIVTLDADRNRFDFEPTSDRTGRPPCRLLDADRLEPGWFANRRAGCNLSAYQPAAGSLLRVEAIESPCMVPHVAPYGYALYSVASDRRWLIVERTAASDRCVIWWSDAAADDTEPDVPFVQTHCVQMMVMARLAERAHLPHNRTFPPLGDGDLFRSMTSFIRGTNFLTEDLDGQINQRASMETVLGELSARWDARQAEAATPAPDDDNSPDDENIVEYVNDDDAVDRTDPLVEILVPDVRDGGSVPLDDPPVVDPVPSPSPSPTSPPTKPPTKPPMRPLPDVYPVPKKVQVLPPLRPAPFPPSTTSPTTPPSSATPPTLAPSTTPPRPPHSPPPVYGDDSAVENQPDSDYDSPPGQPTTATPRLPVHYYPPAVVATNPSAAEVNRSDAGGALDTPESVPVIGVLPLAVGAVGIIGTVLIVPLAVIVYRQWSKNTKVRTPNQAATATHVTIQSSEQPLIAAGGHPRGEREHTYINMAR